MVGQLWGSLIVFWGADYPLVSLLTIMAKECPRSAPRTPEKDFFFWGNQPEIGCESDGGGGRI